MRARCADIARGEAKAPGKQSVSLGLGTAHGCVPAAAMVFCSGLFAAWIQVPAPKFCMENSG